MPLVGYHLIGFDRGPLSFKRGDHLLLQQPEHRERVEAFFSRTPWRFNLIFLNCDAEERVWIHGEVTDSGLQTILEQVCEVPQSFIVENNRRKKTGEYQVFRQHPIWKLRDPDAINYLYINNLPLVSQIPMTPWIMAHRMAHAPSLYGTNETLLHTLLMWNEVILGSCYGFELPVSESSFGSPITGTNLYYLWFHKFSPWDDKASKNARIVHGLYQGITTSRAGRTHQIRLADYVPEWFAQYILYGRPRFGKLPEVINTNIIPGNTPEDFNLQHPEHPVVIKKWNKEAESTAGFETDLIAYFNEVLKQWTGKVCVI